MSRCSSVVNLHLAVQKTSSDASGLQFQYRVIDGRADEIPHYGLQLAQLADLPGDVLRYADKAAHHLANLDAVKKQASKTTKLVARRKAVLRLRTQLDQAHDHSTLPPRELKVYLRRLQAEAINAIQGSLSHERVYEQGAGAHDVEDANAYDDVGGELEEN